MKIRTHNLAETHKVATEFLANLKPGVNVVALQGDLGSGKTAFTQEAGKLLGVMENMHSPTFVIMKIYEINETLAKLVGGRFKKFIHIDAYRLESADELLKLGWEELTKQPENLIFIEWPERVAEIIPKEAKKISFEFIDEQTREIEYED